MNTVRKRCVYGVSLICLLILNLHAYAQGSLEGWMEKEKNIAERKMLLNISPSGSQRGSVAASPSKENPNYYYHWVRDGGLTMEVVERLYEMTSDPALKNKYDALMLDYIEFSRENQLIPTLTGLGEPKFNMDGSAFNDPWGRPQNDGPAIRAITLIHFANALLRDGKADLVRTKLYDRRFQPATIIKTDLEYVAHHWQESSFDLWEEVKGDHFYTKMVQRRALIEGAQLAQKIGDPDAANWYFLQAKRMEIEIEKHWNPEKGFMVATLNRDGGLDYKHSGLDVAIILGVLHGETQDGFMSVLDDRILATATRLEEAFSSLYSINHNGLRGVAIGRYPEDQYFGGNPWILATLALAEFYYKRGDMNRGNDFMARVQLHANPDGSLSEQMDRNNGFMMSARDLTWNYAAFVTARLAAH